MKNALPFLGARLLTPEQTEQADLGPLRQLIGTWKNAPLTDQSKISTGWNVISVPGVPPEQLFVYEVIPYSETFTFSPVAIQAGNRAIQDQTIFGIMYQQDIVSVCTTDFCNERGFSAGTPIHAETGLLLHITDHNGGYSLARLATIPHGNTLLALGGFETGAPTDNNFIPPSPATPTALDGSGTGINNGYTDQVVMFNRFQFPGIFNQADPNSFLTETLGNSVITDMTTISMSTRAENSDAGILNIPFIQSNANATSMDFTFWIQTIKGQAAPQLQYTQTINLVFPPSGTVTPVVWPHITINTLVKQ